MDEYHKKVILNPVLGVPWKTQPQNYTCPYPFFHQLQNNKEYIEALETNAKTTRMKNVETLMTRFPGLKKYEARAALTMSKNKLQKAIVLLEVSKSVGTEDAEKVTEKGYLRDIRIKLGYTSEEQDPIFRNVVVKSTKSTKNRTYDSAPEVDDIPTIVLDSDGSDLESNNSVGSKDSKVGVVITKTVQGYKATPLEENRQI